MQACAVGPSYQAFLPGSSGQTSHWHNPGSPAALNFDSSATWSPQAGVLCCWSAARVGPQHARWPAHVYWRVADAAVHLALFPQLSCIIWPSPLKVARPLCNMHSWSARLSPVSKHSLDIAAVCLPATACHPAAYHCKWFSSPAIWQATGQRQHYTGFLSAPQVRWTACSLPLQHPKPLPQPHVLFRTHSGNRQHSGILGPLACCCLQQPPSSGCFTTASKPGVTGGFWAAWAWHRAGSAGTWTTKK